MDSLAAFLLLCIIIIPLPIAAWLWFRWRGKRFAAVCWSLVSIYGVTVAGRVALGMWLRESIAFAFVDFYAWPLQLLGIIVSIAVAVLLSYRYGLRYVVDTEASHNYADAVVLKDAIATIFDSERFLTTLRTALPVGAEDPNYGLDYIPFMLHSIEERRRRASLSARLFLTATVVSAVLFASVVIFFGYILVNEAAAGTAKELAQINETVTRLAADVRAAMPTVYRNPLFVRDVLPQIQKLVFVSPPANVSTAHEEVKGLIIAASATGDYSDVIQKVRGVYSAVPKDVDPVGRSYVQLLQDVVTAVERFEGAQRQATGDLRVQLDAIAKLIPQADAVLAKPENRIPELIKRLALGIVIATFFLALLRYLGNLYKLRYSQVLTAERDDFLVRRFYVAFKSSAANSEQRSAVLGRFMADLPVPDDVKDAADETSKQQFDILKELFAALSKKL